MSASPAARAAVFWQQSLGKKSVMAVSGIILSGSLLIHMLGNLQIYLGREVIIAYGRFLHEGTHGLIWVARAVLLLAVLVHIVAAFQLAGRATAARPQRYMRYTPIKSSLSSRTMIWGGVT